MSNPGIAIESVTELYNACRQAFIDITALLATLDDDELASQVRAQMKKTAEQCGAAIAKANL